MQSSAVQIRRKRMRVALPVVVGIVVFALGLAGQVGAGLGYGLLLVSVVLLSGGMFALGLLVFTQRFSTEGLTGAMRWLFLMGAWMYIIGVCALTGFFVLETLARQVELKWILFGPAAILALIFFDIGMYRIVYQKNRPTWIRYKRYISRDQAEPDSMRATFMADVVIHSSLFSVSSFRWLRHTLILWGFTLMFAVEVVAVFVREGIPAFGFEDIWEIPGHPVRLAFDFAFDFFGILILIGCFLALLWRIRAAGTEEQQFSDTPSAVFLFLVVLSGFVVEAARLVADGLPAGSGFSFAGYAFVYILSGGADFLGALHTPMWYMHVFGSLAFIAYVPVYRLVHSCATPIGRLMNSQKKMLAHKRTNSLQGLLSNTNSTIKIRD